MTQMEDRASELFGQGYNCAQSVLAVCSDFLDLDKNLATGIASGFGAGMGRLQHTCGAVSAAYMVIGLYSGQKFGDNDEIKEASYYMVKEFDRKFREEMGTSNCRELIGVDLNTDEGSKKFKEDELMQKVCDKCIRTSVHLLCTTLD